MITSLTDCYATEERNGARLLLDVKKQ